MANYADIKATIDANIKLNNNQAITGQILNSVLNAMVNSLGAGYQFIGVATPSTNPGSPDNKAFYLAATPGTYTNFGGSVDNGQICLFKWDTSWHKEVVFNSDTYAVNSSEGADLEIADADGNVLVRFSGGNIQTKNFDSSVDMPTITSASTGDLEIADADGNILVRFQDGQIKTKNFDSSKVDSLTYATPFETEEQAVYDKVINNIDDKTIVLVLTTDAHITPEESNTLAYPKVFRKMAENIGADALVSLGDIINEKTGSTWNANNNRNRIEYYMKETRVSCIPFLYALAHHEMYTSGYHTFLYGYPATKVLGKTNKYQRHLSPVFDPDNSANFYVDVYPQDLRMIFLDSTNVAGHPVGYTTATINWLTSVLAQTDKKVALFTHAPSKNGYTYNPGNQYSKVVNDTLVMAALNNFVSGGGVLLGHFCGHAHCDNLGKDADMNYYIIQTACSVPRVDGGVPSNERPTAGTPIYYSTRTIGTINEYCVDFVCIHTDTNVVNMFRFGVGQDRTINNT